MIYLLVSVTRSILSDPPANSELVRWIEEGNRLEPSHSNIVAIDAPEEPYGLRVQLDDPVHSHLIDLYYQSTRLARTVVDDRETAGQIAAELAAAASGLRELNEQSKSGPERIDRVEIEAEQGSPPTPDKWSDQKTNGNKLFKMRTTALTSHAQRDHWLQKPLTDVTTTISNSVRVIPSPHSTSHLPPLVNEGPTLNTATTVLRVRKPIRNDPALSTS